MKYRLPGGPPPPLHVNGAKTINVSAEATTAAKVSSRHGRARSALNSHARTAMTPGKKYGTRPKWRPTRKYFTFNAKRYQKFVSTFSASESLVLISMPLRSQASGAAPSNGNVA